MRWRLAGKWIESTEHKQLVRAETSCRAEVDRSKRQRNLLMEIKTEKVRLQSAAQNNLQQATSDTDRIANVGLDLAAYAERARVDLAGSIPERVRVWSDRWNLAFLLKAAAFALVIVIATPFLVRIFCYFILAPIAMRRPPIRLRLPEGGCVPRPASGTIHDLSCSPSRLRRGIARTARLFPDRQSGDEANDEMGSELVAAVHQYRFWPHLPRPHSGRWRNDHHHRNW